MADSPSGSGSGVVRLSVLCDGSPIDDSIQVFSVLVRKRANAIPIARLVLRDGDMPNKDFPLSNKATFKPGVSVRISAGYDEQEEPIFSGIVVKHGIRVSGQNRSELIVECRDPAVAMTIGRRNANYVDSTDSDIINKLVGAYSGLSSDVAATDTQMKETVQYYCTDWDFMLARAEVNGLLVIADGGKVTVRPPNVSAQPALKVTYGEDLLRFEAEMDARSQLDAVAGAAWDPKEQAVVSYDASPATLNKQGDLTSATLAAALGSVPFRMQTPAPLEKASLEAWTKARQVKAGLARIRGSMTFQGSSSAAVGGLIELDGVGTRFNGNVFVSAVVHEIAHGNWTTEAEFGMTPDWFVERKDVTAPLASGWTPGLSGLHIGVVMKLDENPDGEPMVQVKVPVLEAESPGVWARLTKFYASDGIGAFFIPEIGDEVILGFLNGDPSYPVIVGSVYSSKRAPPYPLTADNFTKALVTRSKLEIQFDDEKKVVTVSTPAANKVVLSDDQKSIVLEDQNQNRVELGPDGITLDSPKDITINAKGKITVSAMGEISVSSKADVKTSGMNVNNEAQVGFVAKGSATAELSAAGQTTVKGAMVLIN